MKKLLLLVSVLLVSACSVVPVQRTMPEIPSELKEACPELQLVKPDETKLSAVVSTVTQNYGQYHECRAKTEMILRWYESQKDNFNSVK